MKESDNGQICGSGKGRDVSYRWNQIKASMDRWNQWIRNRKGYTRENKVLN